MNSKKKRTNERKKEKERKRKKNQLNHIPLVSLQLVTLRTLLVPRQPRFFCGSASPLGRRLFSWMQQTLPLQPLPTFSVPFAPSSVPRDPAVPRRQISAATCPSCLPRQPGRRGRKPRAAATQPCPAGPPLCLAIRLLGPGLPYHGLWVCVQFQPGPGGETGVCSQVRPTRM